MISNLAARLGLGGLIGSLLLASCAPPPRDRIDQNKLNTDIDQSVGGLGTCVTLLDTQTGRRIYRYGEPAGCLQLLPPCETFEPVAALIGLDAGLITPRTVFKWDGSAQPTEAWQADSDLAQAFQTANRWWFGRLSQQIGEARYTAALNAFDYGGRTPAGPITSFWQGPAHGGGLGISDESQAGFMQRLFSGKLPVKAQSLRALEAALPSDTHGDATVSAIAGSCSDRADQSRGVGWWVGRLKSPRRDLVFAAVVESATPPPGSDIADNLKASFADVGLWPPGS